MECLKRIVTKSFICLFTCLFMMALVLSSMPHAVANESDYEYTDNGDGTATITGYTGPEGVDIVIPSELGGLTVTKIADGGNLLSGVFSHKNLSAVDMPDSVTSIGEHAFNDNQLTEVTIPDSVTSIGRSAFHNNNLEAIIIPESVTDMGIAIFRGNKSISSQFIIYGFTGSVAETYANDRNHTFKPLDTPPSVNIQYADEPVADELQVDLQSSGELEAVYNHDTDVVEFDDVLWEVDGTTAGTGDTLQLDAYTDTIGQITVTLTVKTNYGITASTEITLDVMLPAPDQPELRVGSRTDTSIILTWESVAHADKYILVRDGEKVYEGTTTSFEDSGLEPDTVFEYSLVAVNASGTSEAATITATTDLPPPPFDYTDNGDGTATINGWNYVRGNVPSDLVIPDEIDGLTVTRIRDGVTFNDGAFERKDIETLELPETLEYIGNRAFMYNNLSEVELSDNVTEIGLSAFSDNQLTRVNIPDRVRKIGPHVFARNNLTEVVIPDNVTHMEDYAFATNSLTEVTVFNPNANFGRGVVMSNSSELTLYGYGNSTTEDYAIEEGYDFIALDSAPDVRIVFNGEEVDSELALDYGETGQLEAEYSHPVADIKSVTWLVEGVAASTNETLNVSDYTSIPKTWDVALHVETEYGAVGIADIEITVAPPAPETPNLSVDSTKETEIHLSWESVAHADEYILVRDGEKVYEGTATSFEDSGLKPDTAYNYSLVAVNSSGMSEAIEIIARSALPVPSTMDITLVHADGSPYLSSAWANQSVTAAVYAYNEHGVPVDTLFYSLNNGANWQEYTAPLKFIAEGVHALLVRAQDDATNVVEVEQTIRIDLTPPSVRFEKDGIEAWSTLASTTVIVTDSAGQAGANSGVDDASLRYAWTLDSSPPDAGAADWKPFTNGENLVKENADGDWYLHIQAADTAGNEEQATTNRFRLNTSDAFLSDLILSEGELRPAFAAETFEYTVTVPNRVSEITVKPVVADEGSTVGVRVHDESTQSVPSGQASEPLPLHVDDNTVVVEVTALNGTVRHYILHIVREARSSSSGGSGGAWQSNSRLVGIHGAVIFFNGGEIEIPSGSWTQPFRLTIDTMDWEQATDTLSLMDDERFVSKIVTLTKDQEGSFQEAITLTLELDLNAFDSNLARVQEGWTIRLYGFDEEANEWGELDNIVVDGKQGMVSGTINHFTSFAAIARPVEKDELDHEEPLEQREPKDVNPKMTFTDLDGHWAEEAIVHLVEQGAIQGYPGGTFQPNQTMTRGEFVTMVIRALNLEGRGVSESTDRAYGMVFTDSEHHWAREAIVTAVVHGIVLGYDESIFGVNDTISREQMALIVQRAMGLQAPSESVTFTDQLEISASAVEAVAVLQAEGVMTGYPDGSFRPQQEVTRAEAAIVVSKVLSYLQNE